MTNVVVWLRPNSGEIWAVADSRVSKQTTSQTTVSVTEQAVKILPLDATVYCRSLDHDVPQPFWTLRMGLCYAGVVVPALMTYATASFFLSNLVADPCGHVKPANVAELVRSLSERYIRDAGFSYPVDATPPACEFCLFGQSPGEDGSDELWAYHIYPQKNTLTGFRQTVAQVDLGAGNMVILGEDRGQLEEDIRKLEALQNPSWGGVEPRIALRNRILRNRHEAVGGVLQGAILSANRFERFGSVHDQYGGMSQNWLGFNYQKEIADLVGMQIGIRALLG